MPDIEEIIDNFSVLDDWDDRYRYLIELGRELPPLPEAGAQLARYDFKPLGGRQLHLLNQRRIRAAQNR